MALSHTEGVEVQLHSFLTHVLDGQQSASRPGRFDLGKQRPDAIKHNAAAGPEPVSYVFLFRVEPRTVSRQA
jgi:hypothetical protein